MAEDMAPSQTEVPPRQVRAVFDDRKLVVYQAYSPEIADRALDAGRFVPPFKVDRMTWIKPSFLWMMYRSGYGTKPGQERVLAITISRAGFEWALANACLSSFETGVYAGVAEWTERKSATPVRVQWDPERGLHHEALSHRAIQIGLGGAASRAYVDEWTACISDVTAVAHAVRDLVASDDLRGAAELLPDEKPYPLPVSVRSVIGASN